mmetsp:Transcript_11681/g.27100  ORF Transcript_11681/g.27100 Transcript_11681/m.27100 type:complete len:399 (-) Transcript_11681:236-1432(-)
MDHGHPCPQSLSRQDTFLSILYCEKNYWSCLNSLAGASYDSDYGLSFDNHTNPILGASTSLIHIFLFPFLRVKSTLTSKILYHVVLGHNGKATLLVAEGSLLNLYSVRCCFRTSPCIFLKSVRGRKLPSSPHVRLVVLGIVPADSQAVVAKGCSHDHGRRPRNHLFQGFSGRKGRQVVVQEGSQRPQVLQGRRFLGLGGVDADGQAVHPDGPGDLGPGGHDGGGDPVEGGDLYAAHQFSGAAPLGQIEGLVGRSYLFDGRRYGVGDSKNLIGVVGEGLGKCPKERRRSCHVLGRVQELPFSRHDTGNRRGLSLSYHFCLVFEITDQHLDFVETRFVFFGASPHQVGLQIGQRERGRRRDIGGDGREQRGRCLRRCRCFGRRECRSVPDQGKHCPRGER